MKKPALLSLALASFVCVFALSSCAKKEAEKPAPPTAPAPGAPATPPPAPGAAPAPSAEHKPEAVNITPEARTEAQQLFSTRCAACHGQNGMGDGPTSAALNPKPRNFHDQAWQKSVTDEHIEKTIVQGGAAVGKSPLMVPNPDLASKPAVVAALRQIVRSFGQQK